LTVLVPWLIGSNLLRGSFLHPTDSGVWDTDVRTTGSYFLADWIGGCAVLLLGASVVILIGKWKYRETTIIAGIAVAVLAVAFVLPASYTHWRNAENASIDALRSTQNPAGTGARGCGSGVELVLTDANGQQALYQTFQTGVLTEKRGLLGDQQPDTCGSVDVYEGWKYVTTVSLPDGQSVLQRGYFDQNMGVSGGPSVAEAFVWVFTSSNELLGFGLATPDQVWRIGGAFDPEDPHYGTAVLPGGINIYVPRGGGAPGSYLEVYNGVTGSHSVSLNPCVTGGYMTELQDPTDSPPEGAGVGPGVLVSCEISENETQRLWVMDAGGIFNVDGVQVG
jgi:hypothetical protein